MRKICITDVTMKQPEGAALSFREKIELAKLLDRLGADCIECAPIAKKKIDSLLIKSIASAVTTSAVAVPVALSQQGVEDVWAALREAKHPRLQVVAPVSSVQMEYFYHKKAPAMLETVREVISAARQKCDEVEFVAEDACRAEGDFLSAVISAAIECGASIITVCDAAGAMLPDEIAAFVRQLRQTVPAPETVRLGVKCANDLAMADASSVAAIAAGADEVKTCACGSATASLESMAMILHARGHSMDAAASVRSTEIRRSIAQIRRMCSGKSGSPYDSGVRADTAEAVVSVHDDAAAIAKATAILGYDLGDEDVTKVMDAVHRMGRERISGKELDAIVATVALQVPPTYRLDSYMVNAGNTMKATAQLRIVKDDRVLEGVCAGDGPIDAAFIAIEQSIGRHYELDDFQIQSVTEGREAMGEALVKLRSGGKLYSGRGISTNIIGASIQAYINALNKIVYEEAGE